MRHRTAIKVLLVISIFLILLTACDGDSGTLPVPDIAHEPEKENLEPVIIERSKSSNGDHLVIRILRVGDVIDAGGNMSVEHRGEVRVEVRAEDGKIEGKGHGTGETVNDYSPYSMDICRFDLQYEIEGEVTMLACILAFEVYEEILGGTCTHFDPNQTMDYPYAATGIFDDIGDGEFIFTNLGGTDTVQYKTDELVAKMLWTTEVKVWKIMDVPIPGCESIGEKPGPPPTMEPWPTPTWQP